MTRLPAENIGVCPPDVTASPGEYNNPHIYYPTHSQASKFQSFPCPLNCSVHNCAAIQRFSLESVIKQTGNLTTGWGPSSWWRDFGCDTWAQRVGEREEVLGLLRAWEAPLWPMRLRLTARGVRGGRVHIDRNNQGGGECECGSQRDYYGTGKHSQCVWYPDKKDGWMIC
jgi:hypothetical protein